MCPLAQELDELGHLFYDKHVLAIDGPSRVFGGGLGVLAAGLVADSAVHLAGWVSAEAAVHATLLLGMILALAGVLLRAMDPTLRKGSVHAHR